MYVSLQGDLETPRAPVEPTSSPLDPVEVNEEVNGSGSTGTVSSNYVIVDMDLDKFFYALSYPEYLKQHKMNRIRARIGDQASLLFDRVSKGSELDGDMDFQSYMLYLNELQIKKREQAKESHWRFD